MLNENLRPHTTQSFAKDGITCAERTGHEYRNASVPFDVAQRRLRITKENPRPSGA